LLLGDLVPADITPEELKKHLADKHQFEADDSLSIGELSKLHKRLHEYEEKKTSEKALV
jgi:hypothetical protein